MYSEVPSFLQCLDRIPSKRPTIGQIKAFEWFADMCVNPRIPLAQGC